MNYLLDVCPRCESLSYEQLSSHSHCIDCLYFEDLEYTPSAAYRSAIEAEKELAKLEKEVRVEKQRKLTLVPASDNDLAS